MIPGNRDNGDGNSGATIDDQICTGGGQGTLLCLDYDHPADSWRHFRKSGDPCIYGSDCSSTLFCTAGPCATNLRR